MHRTLGIFHINKARISIKSRNKWHLGVVSVAVPESSVRAFPSLQEVEEKDRSEGYTGREWVAVVQFQKDWQGNAISS